MPSLITCQKPQCQKLGSFSQSPSLCDPSMSCLWRYDRVIERRERTNALKNCEAVWLSVNRDASLDLGWELSMLRHTATRSGIVWKHGKLREVRTHPTPRSGIPVPRIAIDIGIVYHRASPQRTIVPTGQWNNINDDVSVGKWQGPPNAPIERQVGPRQTPTTL
jgi:hypothetical protein